MLACQKLLKVFFRRCGFFYFVWQHNFFAMLSWGERNTLLKNTIILNLLFLQDLFYHEWSPRQEFTLYIDSPVSYEEV